MFKSALVGSLVAATVVGFTGVANAAANPVVGQVFQPTNSAAGNAVAVFDRHQDGTLTGRGSVATGGLGTGASLGSQGGAARDGNVVFVVNAGDNSISALRLRGGNLELADRIGSGGSKPVSVTVRDGIGYVLNHDSDSVSGFTYSGAGDLQALPDSTRSLTPNPAGGLTDAAEVELAPGNGTLVVTEKAANRIDTFALTDGHPGAAQPHASAGTVPYGFDFGDDGTLVVSEAATGSASSYRVAPTFANVTAALANTQAAACWLIVTGDYAWVVNAASASVSSYRIGSDGALTLVQAVAASTGAGPTDAAASTDGRQLFVRLRDGSVQSFAVGHGGSLTSDGTAFVTTNFGTAGLVAR